MPIYELDGVAPRIDADAFVHPDAVVIGDVDDRRRLERVAAAPSCAATTAPSRSASGSSIQDGTVVHAGPGFPTIIGDGCVVGHLTHLEGCTLEDESLAGSGSVVLHWAVIGHGRDGRRQRGGAQPHGRPARRARPRRAGQDPRGPVGRAA